MRTKILFGFFSVMLLSLFVGKANAQQIVPDTTITVSQIFFKDGSVIETKPDAFAVVLKSEVHCWLEVAFRSIRNPHRGVEVVPVTDFDFLMKKNLFG
jgi:hypothetical protein